MSCSGMSTSALSQIGSGRGGCCCAIASLWMAMPRTKAPVPMKVRKPDHAATTR
jgi:hypothetical protein